MELTDVFQNTESPPRPRHQTKRDNQNWEAYIKTLNHFSPNGMRIALFFACDGGAGVPQITNNFEKHQSAPAPIFHREIDLPTCIFVGPKGKQQGRPARAGGCWQNCFSFFPKIALAFYKKAKAIVRRIGCQRTDFCIFQKSSF